ncbi:helix-turn-helix domain-containing protein [[Clostridium] polysaccharolyticum]|uniref:AraC-type DNA-binding protein n=1 Tax=[Clostridium] polysaccharolyticum TaxID=29364 RepID=A0A1I0DDT2_9FIRM|nr:AraC family transcriptional regulator [[Clostridium] polysaccharolyticum]SET30400.1 AraC-type DNA-binding protein [[Clostridium] polysaccharolyticum]
MDFNPVVVDVTNTKSETLFLPPGKPYPKRITRFYEVELITGGAGSMTTAGKKYCTMRGNIFLRKPGVETQGIAGYFGYGIAFDPVKSQERETCYNTTIPYWVTDSNTQIEDYGFFDDYPDYYLTRQIDEFEELFARVVELAHESKTENQETMKELLKEIFKRIDSEIQSGGILKVNKSALRHYDLILSCKTYIDNNLEKHFTLDDLAAQCGLSKNFFSKTFKEIMGMTPFEYIIENRMLLARKLILTTNISIDQIVNLCGFDDRTYFYRMFKKRFHEAPSVYRKNFIEYTISE